MQLEHSFDVPVGIADAWAILLDIDRIGPCMPGATIESVEGDDFTGSVKVKLGPINLTYKGKASFVDKDEAAHRAVIDARGRDARGNGTASAKVTATLREAGGSDGAGDATTVTVVTDLDITGKPAQFGRGVMVDVGNKLIGQFAACLAETITGGGATTETTAATAGTPARKTAVKKSTAATAAAKSAATKSATKKTAAKKGAAVKKAAAAKKSVAKTTAAKSARSSAAAKTSVTDQAATDFAPSDEPISGSAPQPAAESVPLPDDADTAAPVAAAATPTFAAPTGVPTSAASTSMSASVPEEPSVNGHSSPHARREAEPIDLLASAGPAVVKRVAPVVGSVAVAAVIVLIARKRRAKR